MDQNHTYGSKSHLLTGRVCIIKLCIQANGSLIGLQMGKLRSVAEWNSLKLLPTTCTQLPKCQRAGKITQFLFLIVSAVNIVVIL